MASVVFLPGHCDDHIRLRHSGITSIDLLSRVFCQFTNYPRACSLARNRFSEWEADHDFVQLSQSFASRK